MGPAPKASGPSNADSAAAIAPQSFHPLESRLAKWRTQQESLKMELLRRQFGIAEPVKRQMELGIVRAGEWQPACLGGVTNGASVHADILAGRDCEIGWEDVFTGGRRCGIRRTSTPRWSEGWGWSGKGFDWRMWRGRVLDGERGCLINRGIEVKRWHGRWNRWEDAA